VYWLWQLMENTCCDVSGLGVGKMFITFSSHIGLGGRCQVFSSPKAHVQVRSHWSKLVVEAPKILEFPQCNQYYPFLDIPYQGNCENLCNPRLPLCNKGSLLNICSLKAFDYDNKLEVSCCHARKKKTDQYQVIMWEVCFDKIFSCYKKKLFFW